MVPMKVHLKDSAQASNFVVTAWEKALKKMVFPVWCKVLVRLPAVYEVAQKQVMSATCGVKNLTSTEQTRKLKSLLFLTPLCPGSPDTPPAVPLLHLWHSRVYSESPKYQTGARNTVSERRK